ncbi:ribosome maturation factor RimP, partial [bacterium]|nr:ribosome maturation factor RimP [bacterium]
IMPILDNEGYELVELRDQGTGRSRKLQVFIYRQSGFDVEDCARISRKISDELDLEDLISTHYFLEVSSPGLDRKLTTLRDFTRNLGQDLDFVFKDGKAITGTLLNVDNNQLDLLVNGEKQGFSLNQIHYAKISIKMGRKDG